MAKLRLKVQMSGKKYWQSPAYTEKHGWAEACNWLEEGNTSPFLEPY